MLARPTFSLVFSRALGRIVVDILGPLDACTAREVMHRLVDVIDGQGNRRLVIDLRRTTVVDAEGLSVLVDAQNRLQKNGGDLVLSGPRGSVAQALRAAGLDKLLVVTPAWDHPAHGVAADRRGAARLDYLN